MTNIANGMEQKGWNEEERRDNMISKQGGALALAFIFLISISIFWLLLQCHHHLGVAPYVIAAD